MGKLLLTSGQVSVLLSTTIVCVFTFALFLAGYILQQQTVNALRLSFKPQEPLNPNTAPQLPLAQSLQSSSRFGGSVGSAGNVAYQNYLSPAESSPATADWNRLAHVQLVKTHHDVCSSIMLFAALHERRSPARRILLFPQAWAADLAPKKGETSDPFTMSTRRLLKLAARRYRVELRPITTLVEGANEDDENNYSLASVFALADIERAMVLQTPGLVLEAEGLDQVLAYSPDSPLGIVERSQELRLKGDEVLLIHPARDTFAALRASELANTTSSPTADVSFIRHILPDPLILDAETNQDSPRQILRSIGTLRDAPIGANVEKFNATSWLKSTSYIRFSDDKLSHGPEYDSPWEEKRAARPKSLEADWLWTSLYGRFAQERSEVCGLDLEVWRGV